MCLEEEEDEFDEETMLGLLNGSFPLTSPSGLGRQNSLEAERRVALEKVRFNELSLNLSFKSQILNVTDLHVGLSTWSQPYRGTWPELGTKVRNHFIRSVLKVPFSRERFRERFKAKPKALPGTPERKSIFRSIFKGGQKKGGQGETEEAQKRRLLFGDRPKKPTVKK